MTNPDDKEPKRWEELPIRGDADEDIQRDPDTVPNAPNRQPAEPPDSSDLINQSDASDGVEQSGETSEPTTT
jgi:hypothetical protein